MSTGVSCGRITKEYRRTPPQSFEYPPRSRLFDCVPIDVLQLPPSYQGSKYVVVTEDMFPRFVILYPTKENTACAVAHPIVWKPICKYSTPRVLLIDNGAEFRNKVLQEIFSQFGIVQTLGVAYHSATNDLVELRNMNICIR